MRHLLLAVLALLTAVPAWGVTRGKDVASFHGLRDNQLTGAGLVVGLQRTGDSVRSRASISTLGKRLEGLGVSVADEDILARNVALVMVTATLPPDSRTGQRLDVTVASTGDARSLMGGYLLITPLVGPDNQVYAVAEGSVVVGGFAAEAGGSSVQTDITTVGRVVSGGLVEREVATAIDFNVLERVEYVLHDPDYTTSARLAESINAAFGEEVAVAKSSSTVDIAVPEEYRGKFAMFAAQVEAVELTVDAPARVVINGRTGTVVMGADVRLSPVAVAHGGLTIEVRRDPLVSQPAPLSGGTTVKAAVTTIETSEEDGQLVVVEGVSIGELVGGLNAMGVKPRDLIVILQAMAAAGALQAEIVAL